MRGIGVYIIIVFAVICIWYWLSAGATSNSYTQSQFEKDLDKNQVKSVKVVQNREIPTGSLEVKFKDGTSKVLLCIRCKQYRKDHDKSRVHRLYSCGCSG